MSVSLGSLVMPRNENVWLPVKVGTGKTPSELPLTSKYWIVVPDRSTSEKTAPNPRTPAGTVPFVPGIEKNPSVTLLPMGANSRLGLKGAKRFAYVGLMVSRLSRPPVAAAWVSPVPGVVNVAPRMFWKVVKGVTGAVPLITGGPPPSQLISRRPDANGAGVLPLFGFPRAAW
jgi:hypothetical protein